MILTNSVCIKTKYNNNLSYYKNLGYDVSLDEMNVLVTDIPINSRSLIDVRCEACNDVKRIQYSKYNASISKGGYFCCSRKCATLKRKSTNLEKYGVEVPIQSEEIFNKLKNTNFERYGVDHASQNDEIRNKIKCTNLKKYGVENPFQSELIREKIKESNINNLGFEYPTQSKCVIDKVKNTNFLNHGGTGFDSDKTSKKIKKCIHEKYGVEYASQNVDIKNKIKETNFNRYGVDSIEKNSIYRSKYSMCNDKNYIRYIGDKISEFKCDCDKDHTFKISTSLFFNRSSSKISLCTICFPVGDNSSIKEKELLNYISSIYSGNIISGYKDLLEIDIYLPELKIGFEFNGLYWHSDEFKSKRYHLEKLNFFKSKGIRIIYIWEDSWLNKRDIIKSQILNWLKLNTNIIYARKTKISIINDISLIRSFLNTNHIQGYVNSSIGIGLFIDNELVTLMTFDKFEGRKKMKEDEWNLSRLCSKLNTNIAGSASKLLNFFIKKFNPKRIISFSDKEWSNGDIYFNLGFDKLYESDVNYKYVINGERKNKQNFKKSNLVKIGYDKTISEGKIMESIGYYRVYDCGQMKFEKIIS